MAVYSPNSRSSSTLASGKIMSRNSRRLRLTWFFFALPNSRRIRGSSSSACTNGSSLYRRARSVRSFPFRLLPGIMGRSLSVSRITGESTAPMAAKAEEPPMCIPVRTSSVPVISNLLYMTYPPISSLCRRNTCGKPSAPPCSRRTTIAFDDPPQSPTHTKAALHVRQIP